MRTLFFLLFLLSIDLYAFQAVRTSMQGTAVQWRNLVYGIYWFIPALAVLMMFTSDWNWPKQLWTFLRAMVFIAYLSKFFIAVVVLLDDLRRLLGMGYHWAAGKPGFDASRSRFLSQLGLMIGAVPFTSLTYGMIRNPYRYKVYRQDVALDQLPEELDGLRIVQISDIHSGSFNFKEPVESAIAMINAEQPDLVFFTGDLVNNVATEMEPFVDVFDKIQAKHGVYSILGNHDYGDYVPWKSPEEKRANMERLYGTHRQMGWDLLLNEHRLLNIKGRQLAVIGVENFSAHFRFPKYGDLAAAAAGTESADLHLLLSHDPSHWEYQVLNDYPHIAITFSGHTHGMQFGVEIPGWFKWSPIQYVYKQWAGLYRQGGQYLYVNRGLGFLGYPGRVGILPEISVLTLRRNA